MISLFETYGQASWDLHYSLMSAGYTHPTIVLNDDGFLPNDVTSPYLFFTGFKENAQKNPRYFNQVPVPEFWEIRGNNSEGEIVEFHKKRGHIHYASPSHQRFVKVVDWYDENGKTRVSDRYNKEGYRFAQTVYDATEHPILTTYFNQSNQEVIVENHVTGDVILQYLGQTHIFKSRPDFVIFYLQQAGFNLNRIFYNSLGLPFLVAYYLGKDGQDVLFWQEGIGQDLPGNMKVLLKDSVRHTKVMVQDAEVYDKMQPLLTPEQAKKIAFLGFNYAFHRWQKNKKEALILTNSDQIEHLEELLQTVPDLTIHVAALTEMSARLLDLGKYPNIKLYPNVQLSMVDELYQTCAIYLDINHGSEILSATRRAFEHQMVILSFTTTVHNPTYVAPKHIFEPDKVGELTALLQSLFTTTGTDLLELLHVQQASSNLASKEAYQSLLG